MKRSIAAIAIASASLILLTVPAPAGSGIGKGMVAPVAVSGTVGDVYSTSRSFSCHCESGDWTFATTPSTIFRKGEGPGGFSDLVPGAPVEIQYHFAGGGVVTDEVVIGP